MCSDASTTPLKWFPPPMAARASGAQSRGGARWTSTLPRWRHVTYWPHSGPTSNDECYDELIVVRDVPFQSLCMHHMLPFHGIAHVAYLPGERIVGLSKLGRVVDLFARDLQVQERLTTQVADWLDARLAPRGVGVILEAEHLCMSLRGAQKAGSRTVTSALRGLVKEDARTRQEFLSLVRGP
jgi:GTP cyclohydrolase IA